MIRFLRSVLHMPSTPLPGKPVPPVTAVRPPLLSRALMLRLVTVVGASVSFFLLLSVVPLQAGRSGGGDGAAGLAMGSLMLATVFGELAAPGFVARFGHRPALALGLVLLGAPALALPLSGNLPWITAMCAVRGLGFALTVVAGGALTASLIPVDRRGEGLALVGVVSGVPSLVALPGGVWLAGHVGYTPVAITGAVVALAAVVAVPGLPGRESLPGQQVGIAAAFRTGRLVRPGVVFATTALASGVTVTFLPLAIPGRGTGLVAMALFVQSTASTAARWGAGRYGDRHGSDGLVLPGLILSASGILVTALTNVPAAVLAGTALFGIGFGITQNATLTVMYARVPPSGYGTVSALWNFAYDAGMGIGAVGFALLADPIGYPLAFALTAVLMLSAVVPAWRDRGDRRPQRPPKPER